MILVSLICFGVLTVGLSVLYGLFGEKDKFRGMIICLAMLLSDVLFVITLLNFTNFLGAMAIFFPMGILSIGLGQLVQFVSGDDKVKDVIKKIVFDLGLAFFVVGIVTLSEFNFLGLLCGLLAGLCVGFVFWLFKKSHDKLSVIASIVGYMLVGAMIGCGVWNVIAGSHLVTSIMSLLASVMIFACMTLKTFAWNNEKVRLSFRIILALSLVVMTMSVYFF